MRPGIENGRYDQFVVNATDQMSQDGVNGTPTVLVDGTALDNADLTPEGITAAVQAAVEAALAAERHEKRDADRPTGRREHTARREPDSRSA